MKSTHCVQHRIAGIWWDACFCDSYHQAESYLSKATASVAQVTGEDLEDVLARYRIAPYSRSQFCQLYL